MRETVKALGYVLIVLLSGLVGSFLGVRLGPQELTAREVMVGCGILTASLALLACGPLFRHYEFTVRRSTLMRVVERRMSNMAQAPSSQQR